MLGCFTSSKEHKIYFPMVLILVRDTMFFKVGLSLCLFIYLAWDESYGTSSQKSADIDIPFLNVTSGSIHTSKIG